MDRRLVRDSRLEAKGFFEKIIKYPVLKTEAERLWHKPAMVIPMITGCQNLGRHLDKLCN